MTEEEKKNQPETADTEAPTPDRVSGGTPLKDNDETPLYVVEEKHEPVIGIGPGTPLNDPGDDESKKEEQERVQAKEPEAKSEAAQPEEKTSSEPEAVSIPKPEPVSVPEPEPVQQEVAVEEQETESADDMDDMEDGDFAAALEQSFNNEPASGEIIQGTVIRIDEDSVTVDVGYKSEGMINKDEFLDAQGNCNAKIGDKVDVLLERKENREGLLVLSKKKVDKRIGWNKAKVALANDSSLDGLVYERCKGGYMVDLGGVTAFLPGSQIDIKQSSNPDAYIGKHYKFKVIKMNKQRGNIVVSRRNYLVDEQNKKRTEAMANLTPGRLVHGVVKNITNYGAFVDIGGVDALLHVNDMSWSKVGNPRNIVNVGDELEVLVLSMDESNGRIAVGLKQKSENPWKDIEEKYPVGSLVEGEVVSLTDFGAFLKIEEGVEGLLPVSELSWTKRVRHPKDVLKEGDSVRVKVLTVSESSKKITMGLRQTEPEPFSVFLKNVKIGDVLTGEVKSFTNYGAFVELAEGVSGLIHISDLSWDNTVKKASDVLKNGEKIQVKILDIQADKKKIALGLKQLSDDPWVKVANSYAVGRTVTGKVVRTTKFGVFVQLEPGVEGLIHISQMEKEKGKLEPAMPEAGTEITAKVVKVNRQEHKIGLSVRELLQDQEKAEIEKYLSPESKPGFSLGDAVGDKMQELLKKVNSNQE